MILPRDEKMKNRNIRHAEKRKNDILHDGFMRVLLNIGVPMLNTCLISILMGIATNKIYSAYVGQTGFAVMGALNSAASMGLSIMGSMALGAWVKSAHEMAEGESERINRCCLNALYVLALTGGCFAMLMSIGKQLIFRWMNVPKEISAVSEGYYLIYVWGSILYAVYQYLGYLVNARCSSRAILIANLLPVISPVIMSYLLLGPMHMDIVGITLALTIPYGIQIIVNWFLLRREGILVPLKRAHWRPDGALMRKFVQYGALLVLQILLCCGANLVTTIQTNRYLSVDCIAVIAVSLPVSTFLAIAGNLEMAFIPPNWAVGNYSRVRKFMRRCMGMNLAVGMFCFLLYALSARWYYASVLAGEELIRMGAQYWFWYGLGLLPMGMIHIFRVFFDAIGMGRVSLLSGVGEFTGQSICAFLLIPYFGNIGRYLATLMGFGLAAAFLMIAYLFLRRRIWRADQANVAQSSL